MEYLQPKYRAFGLVGAVVVFLGLAWIARVDPEAFGRFGPKFVLIISPVVGWFAGCSTLELCERIYHGEFQKIAACLIVGGLVGILCSIGGMYQAHQHLSHWPLGDSWRLAAINGAAIGAVMCLLHPAMLKKEADYVQRN